MILDELKNKRVVIGFADARGMNMTVATFLECDDKFIKISAKPMNADPKIITPGTITFCAIESVDSIVDVSDDKAYKDFLDRLKKQQELREKMQQQQMAQQQQMMVQQQAAATGQAPPAPAEEVTEENVTEFPEDEVKKDS